MPDLAEMSPEQLVMVQQARTNMEQKIWQNLHAVAPNRFDRYRKNKDHSPLVAVARYHWNVSLCEALYPAFHVFEIALRNGVHHSMIDESGERWYEVVNLHEKEKKMLSEAQATLDEDFDVSLRPVAHSPGKLVAQLPLGFWTSILTRPMYEVDVHRPCWANRLAAVPIPQRAPHVLYALLRDIRTLRNRVFHHEPVWNRPDLLERYEQIRTVIDWLNADFGKWMMPMCRFKKCYSDSWTPTYKQFQNHVAKQVDKQLAQARGQ